MRKIYTLFLFTAIAVIAHAQIPATTKSKALLQASNDTLMAAIPKPVPSPYFTTGDKMQAFTATDVNGAKVDLAALHGKVVVLNFFNTTNPDCAKAITSLNKLVFGYKDNPEIVFIAVATDSEADVKKFLQQTPFSYQVIGDGSGIADMYKIKSFPVNVVLDKDGKIAFHEAGFTPYSAFWIRDAIYKVK